MNLRPESTYKACLAWPQGSGESSAGRVKPVVVPTDVQKVEVRCIIAEVDAKEQTRFAQNNQTVTHTLVQKGKPVARRNWIIEHTASKRQFWIRSPDNGGGLDQYTIYYCEELLP